MEQLDKALRTANLKIIKFDISKQRPVSTSEGTMNVEKFCDLLTTKLGPKAIKYPQVFEKLHDISAATDMLKEYAEGNGILKGEKVTIDMPPGMETLTLNMNLSAKSPDDRFFLTHEDETVSKISGNNYLLLHQLSPVEAASAARKVIPEYMPRKGPGVVEVDTDGKVDMVFNVYTPPRWQKTLEEDEKIVPTLPPLFDKLVRHLIPLAEEREFFFDWLHESLFKRAFVFLVLCGVPGSGKNRLKIVMRALHGHANTVDGKKSTLVERFNSQLAEATLAWFDELHYDPEMENNMKELQNDSISIERKGVDATRGTRIYSSIVISNNKPRDNYIAPDARKFVPLVITNKRLEESMLPKEIDALTRKVEDEMSEDFDAEFLARIVKWLKKRGTTGKWPNLEYRGPMFWTLTHTSMSRWQKKAIATLMEPDAKSARWGFDQEKNMWQWSIINSRVSKKNGDRSLSMPDFTTVRAFFEVFRDGKGRKAFSTVPIPGNILGDFWIKPKIQNLEIITDSDIVVGKGHKDEVKTKRKKEKIDL